MNRHCIASLALIVVASMNLGAKPADKSPAPMDALRALGGTWVATETAGGKMAGTCVFRVTAAGSAVVETMFPGSNHEMMNAYHMNGDTLMMTHYCAQGVQPRMKMVSNENGVMKFELIDVTNLPSPDAGHMAGLEIKIDGDTLTETWSYKKDGKLDVGAVIELKRKS
jgi:hypothetical protein